MKAWPAMSLAEAEAALTAPGAPFEIEAVGAGEARVRVWKNGPRTLRDVFVTGRAHGDRTFLVYEDERCSFEGFARATLSLAEALQREGVGKGDRVAIAMRNLPEWPVAFFAALLVGAIATPLNATGSGLELQRALADCGAAVAIVDPERLDRLGDVGDACLALRRILVARHCGPFGDARTGPLAPIVPAVAEWATLPDRPLPDVPIAPEDDATIFYTSGTTGLPKGVLGMHRAGALIVLAGPYTIARNLLRRGEPLPAPTPSAPQKAWLLAIPLFHVTACFTTLCASLHAGNKVVLMRRWETDTALRLIERERVTFAGGVPTIAWQLLEAPRRGEHDLSTLERVSYGGAPGSPSLARRIGEVWPHAVPGIGWGMTETAATFTHVSAEDFLARPDTCGPALPFNAMKVVDADGHALPPGAVGELWVRGPTVTTGYWMKPEATAATLVGGWLRTGDLARIDADGFLTIVDRLKDMLIRGGENIYCGEVENALYEHPAVMDAAVVPVAHPTLGEEPAAVVTLKPDAHADETELRRFVGERIAAFKVPVAIRFSDDPLPRNAAGKIAKAALRALFSAAGAEAPPPR